MPEAGAWRVGEMSEDGQKVPKEKKKGMGQRIDTFG